MMEYILLDDIPEHADLLRALLTNACALEGVQARVALATDNAQAVLDYARQHDAPAVYFLDIEFERAYNGLDIARKVQALHPDTYLVYVTAYQHFSMECCKTHAFDFLLKPISMEDLRACVSAIARDVKRKAADETLTMPLGSRVLVLDQGDVLYFSAQGNFVTAHTTQGDFTWRESLKQLLSRVSAERFLHTHRNYAVNIKRVREVNFSEERLDVEGHPLPMSRRYKDRLRKAITVAR